ncbi:hypothetical protein [Bradyrhizobium sp. AS23.2]|uniref:hypothetical protein n=1 Tax=Bradyrhizobium sp. AS23.2 TaxID=1680155 RepID=UPI001AD83A6E|nr:hypothetical protein [Bradyrhizobium sp. AS23.2]
MKKRFATFAADQKAPHWVEDCGAYRGLEFAELATSISIDGYVIPREIGLALKSNRADPQSLKRVWHCVAKFGSPVAE